MTLAAAMVIVYFYPHTEADSLNYEQGRPWNYAKLISGVLRHGMPIEKTVSLVESLHLDSESINTWKTGVCRALKQYIADGTKSKGKCPQCGQEQMAYQNGCLTCMSCGYSKCG